jgi:hypothetical protein
MTPGRRAMLEQILSHIKYPEKDDVYEAIEDIRLEVHIFFNFPVYANAKGVSQKENGYLLREISSSLDGRSPMLML